MTHTKGPWSIDDKSCIQGDGQQLVVIVYGRTEEERLANLNLIAAAPDIFAALKRANKMLMAAATESQRKEIHRYLSGGYIESIEDAVFKDSLGIEAAIRKAESHGR